MPTIRTRRCFPCNAACSNPRWGANRAKRYRETTEALSEYSKKNIRIQERLNEAPDVIANTLKLKGNEALLKAAEEENKRIATEPARETLSDKARQENATADRMETESRTAKIKELQERITLVEKLKVVNCIPVWDKSGKIRVLKAPPGYDWDGLTAALVQNVDLPLPGETIEQPPTKHITGTRGIPNGEQFGVGSVVRIPENLKAPIGYNIRIRKMPYETRNVTVRSTCCDVWGHILLPGQYTVAQFDYGRIPSTACHQTCRRVAA